jgi:hypothetical protein
MRIGSLKILRLAAAAMTAVIGLSLLTLLAYSTDAQLAPCATMDIRWDHCDAGSDGLGGSTYFVMNGYKDRRVRVTVRKAWRCDDKYYDEDEVHELPAGARKAIGCTYRRPNCGWNASIVGCEILK